VSFDYLFEVGGEVNDYYQHDEVDALTERAALRFGLVNRLKYRTGEEKDAQVREFLWLDMGQTVFPIAGRDNDGHQLGFYDFELVARPLNEWNPVPNMRLVTKGEVDWHQDRFRQFSTGIYFGRVAGCNWAVDYRKDETTKGAIGYGADTQLFERWFLSGHGQFDLEANKSLDYVVDLARHDHDWIITLVLRFDEVTDSVSFSVNFEPKFGGLFRPRRDATFGGNVLRGQQGLADY
jgi:hypothetical protein